MSDLNLYKAWQKAAKDLNLNIQFPMCHLGKEYGILIKDFGSKKGIIATGLESKLDLNFFEQEGYSYSQLGAYYETYDRESTIDTLNDWGYFGDKKETPSWYTGQPWTE